MLQVGFDWAAEPRRKTSSASSRSFRPSRTARNFISEFKSSGKSMVVFIDPLFQLSSLMSTGESDGFDQSPSGSLWKTIYLLTTSDMGHSTFMSSTYPVLFSPSQPSSPMYSPR
jgi:hypothetical protein